MDTIKRSIDFDTVERDTQIETLQRAANEVRKIETAAGYVIIGIDAKFDTIE